MKRPPFEIGNSAKAKAKGVYRGSETSIDIEKVKQLHSQGKGASTIGQRVGNWESWCL